MSATNRSNKRRICDTYNTPIDVIEKLLNNIDLNIYGNEILEPSAGSGNIVKAVKDKYPNKTITAIELLNNNKDILLNEADNVYITDYLKLYNDKKYDIIIGNPPYSLAIEFIIKSLSELNENGVLIFLLRTAFLESKSRYEFWQNNKLSALYTLSCRPSFTGKGTDATSYSWFIWDKRNNIQTIKII